MRGDVVTLVGDPQDGEPLLEEVVRGGRRVRPLPSLEEARARAAAELARLPEGLRGLGPAPRYPVAIAPALRALAADLDAR
jgi:nicotinate phosphoribosyltransferase